MGVDVRKAVFLKIGLCALAAGPLAFAGEETLHQLVARILRFSERVEGKSSRVSELNEDIQSDCVQIREDFPKAYALLDPDTRNLWDAMGSLVDARLDFRGLRDEVPGTKGKMRRNTRKIAKIDRIPVDKQSADDKAKRASLVEENAGFARRLAELQGTDENPGLVAQAHQAIGNRKKELAAARKACRGCPEPFAVPESCPEI